MSILQRTNYIETTLSSRAYRRPGLSPWASPHISEKVIEIFAKCSWNPGSESRTQSPVCHQLKHHVPSRSLRSSGSNLLSVPRVRTCFGSRSFAVAAPAIWNTLPLDIRNSPSIVSRTRLSTVGDRVFPVAAARVWNSLPEHVTSAPSVAVFRSRLKTHLVDISYPDPV